MSVDPYLARDSQCLGATFLSELLPKHTNPDLRLNRVALQNTYPDQPDFILYPA